MKTSRSWHSLKGSVYHDNDHCETVLLMQARNFKTGTGGKPLCRNCASLTAAGFAKVIDDPDCIPIRQSV